MPHSNRQSDEDSLRIRWIIRLLTQEVVKVLLTFNQKINADHSCDLFRVNLPLLFQIYTLEDSQESRVQLELCTEIHLKPGHE